MDDAGRRDLRSGLALSATAGLPARAFGLAAVLAKHRAPTGQSEFLARRLHGSFHPFTQRAATPTLQRRGNLAEISRL